MAESEDEDKDVVHNIEGAQKAVIEAEREEKNVLRKTVTKLGQELEEQKNINAS